MVKKMKSTAEQAADKTGRAATGLLDSHLANSVKDSAQQIWLAGMGAFSKAQEEGGKVFEALVKEGMTLQKKTQGIAEDKISPTGKGETELLVQTGDGVKEPQNRRATIDLK